MTHKETWLRDTLAAHGLQLFNTPGSKVHPFTNDPKADELVKDLDGHPHAFVLACIMDQQYKSELVWAIPYRFQQKLGGDFSMDRLKKLSASEVTSMMTSPAPLHRFATRVAEYFFDGVQRISRQYADNASRIWREKPRCSDVLARFREFRGVGPKIAHMAVNCLVRELKVPLADYTVIDISADVHVLRVFGRLGLTPEDASRDEVIIRARELNPEFPGLLDYPAWEVGRNWCRPDFPVCTSCYMQAGCATAQQRRT